jgi:predicted TIM-barrel fold metal-dependent hydrolase
VKIDIHVHLVGVGTGGSGCWMSPALRRRPVFRYLRWRFGITDEQLRISVDQEWATRIAGAVRESGLDRAAVLGFDGVYDSAGRLDESRSQLVVPPAWVFEACRLHPDALLPAPSLNPFRRDALERLEECIERGAVLLKWLPSAQGIDPASPALGPFYRRLADARLPLLVHAGGGEQTFRELDPALNDIARLRAPLEAGVVVICAHSGAPVVLSRRPDQTPLLRELLLGYPDLWVDNSGMANPSRFPSLPRAADDPLLVERTLYGSDYPIPSSALFYPRRLGPRAVREIQAESNYFDRDVRLKRALGYPDETLTRAAGVLAGRGGAA